MAALQHLLDGLERRKEQYLLDASVWPAEALRYRPAPETWCALDVLDHLERTEKNIAAIMLSNRTSPQALSMGDRVRGTMMLALFYSPARVKIPGAAAVILPETPGGLDEIIAAWGRTRQFLGSVVTKLEDAGVATKRVGVFRHPVAGWMSPRTTLRFLDAHLAHHMYQWKRLRGQALT
jgi:hypothetical protein